MAAPKRRLGLARRSVWWSRGDGARPTGRTQPLDRNAHCRHFAAYGDASGLKNAAAGANLGLTEPTIWRISA